MERWLWGATTTASSSQPLPLRRGAGSGGVGGAARRRRAARPGGALARGLGLLARHLLRRVPTRPGPSSTAGRCNMPTRGVTGRTWDGTRDAWRHAPDQYGAIHFHDDDLDDAGWDVDFEWTVPADLAERRVRRPARRRGERRGPRPVLRAAAARHADRAILFLLPTNSYLAYANGQLLTPRTSWRRSRGLAPRARVPAQPQDTYIVDNACSASTTTTRDGSGVCYSIRLRPIVNMRPKMNDQSSARRPRLRARAQGRPAPGRLAATSNGLRVRRRDRRGPPPGRARRCSRRTASS